MDAEDRYNSLEDYLISTRLDVNGILDDGWGAKFPVKGREIQAVILFCDITNFSGRTYDLNPLETLIFVNNFFAWITAEALFGRPGIVDKYIGDEIMVLFSEDFGSKDPFLDAIQTARFMVERDALDFRPHIGIACGEVIIGYVGTRLKYNCSAFGRTVAIAARCAGIKNTHSSKSSINFPAELWQGRIFEDVFKPISYKNVDGAIVEKPVPWQVQPSRQVSIRNMPDLEVIEICCNMMHQPTPCMEDRVKMVVESLKKDGSYNKLRYDFETEKRK